MNLQYNLLLLKREDKTADIEECRYVNGKYIIRFKGNAKTYEYAYTSVEWFKEPEPVDLVHHHLYKDGKRLMPITQAIFFEEHIRVFFENGNTKVWEKREIEVRKSSLVDKLSHNTLKYFAQVANVMGIRANDGTGLLAKQYEKLTFVDNHTVLATYLNPKMYPIQSRECKSFIVPFGCNSSQKLAVKNALTDSVSVIKGPPGTGKTQTILNVIANILLEGKNVAIVSNNNSATENVFVKLKKYQLDGIVAGLGCRENKKNFIDNQQIESQTYRVLTDEERKGYKDKLEVLHTTMEDMLEKRNHLAEQKTLLDQLLLEKQHFDNYFEETYTEPKHFKIRGYKKSEQLLKVWCRVEKGPMNYLYKVWLVYGQGIGTWDFYKLPVEEIIATLQKYYYETKHREILATHEELVTQLEKFHFESKQKEMEKISFCLLYDVLGQRYNQKEKPIFGEEDLWKNPEYVNSIYPIILSTTHSIRGSLGQQYIYDYLIVDEASQVDLATGILAMACTRKMIIVGDEKQLPNVVSKEDKERAKQIGESYALGEGYQYEKYSLLTSILKVLPDIKTVLLKEHYRCHPKIIQFCNQKFYHNALVIMTEDKGEKDVLKIYQTVAGNHARGHFNQRQLDEIKNYVMPELEINEDNEELGIITPYREQKIRMEADMGCEEVAIDTVHKFQGREKDDIIIATVDNEVTEFVDDPNLLNVAVSRAKKRLRLVVTDKEKERNTNIGDLMRYIIYNNGEILDGNIYSVFDLLYKDYEKQRKAYLKDKKQVSTETSENLIYALLEEILAEDEFCDLGIVVHQPLKMLIKNVEQLDEREIAYVMNRHTHTDFVIFRQVDRSPIMVIEVDGYSYHKEDTVQYQRDQMKDSILKKYQIPYIRLKTNESNEKERIIEKLRKVKVS